MYEVAEDVPPAEFGRRPALGNASGRAITVEIHLIGLSVEASTGIVVTIMSHASTQLIVLRTKSLELKGWTTNSEAIEDEIIDTGAASSQHRKW